MIATGLLLLFLGLRHIYVSNKVQEGDTEIIKRLRKRPVFIWAISVYLFINLISLAILIFFNGSIPPIIFLIVLLNIFTLLSLFSINKFTYYIFAANLGIQSALVFFLPTPSGGPDYNTLVTLAALLFSLQSILWEKKFRKI